MSQFYSSKKKWSIGGRRGYMRMTSTRFQGRTDRGQKHEITCDGSASQTVDTSYTQRQLSQLSLDLRESLIVP